MARFTCVALLFIAVASRTLAAAPFMSIAIGDLALPGGLRVGGIEFSCGALAVVGAGVDCRDGALTVRESPLGRLRIPLTGRLAPDGDALATSDFAVLDGRLRLSLTRDRHGSRLRARLRGIDVALLHAVLQRHAPLDALNAHETDAGRLDLDLDCRLLGAVARPQIGDCTLKGTLDGLQMAGTNSAENARLRFDLAQQRADGLQHWRGELALESGALYLEPGLTLGDLTPGLLLDAQAGAIVATLTATRDADGRLSVQHCRLQHPGVAGFEFDGDATLLPTPGWRDAELHFSTTALDRFYAVYLQPLLLGSSLGGLTALGGLDVRLRVAHGRLTDLDIDCSMCSVDDEQQRFALRGLDGGLRLHAGSAPRASTLRWDSAAVYRIELGAGRIGWTSAHGNLQAVDWQDVPIFDGALHLDDMRLVDFGSPRARLVLAGRIEPVTLSRLTTAFGWPPLAGQLAGTIPSLTLSRRQVGVDGDLVIDVFGGQILLRDLRLTDLFTAVPLLRTDVEVRGIDLAQLTSTFAFGNIEGHLEGGIRDLWLEAWQPVSFDAWLATPVDDDLPHRISRQAVNNLSQIGAGTGGPLAQGWLGLIPSYSYGRLGLGCRLANGICHLRGVEAVPDGGFKLLTRGGWLPPWIEIRGAGEQVAWQTLLDGVAQIAQGGVEVEVNVGSAQARPLEPQP